MEASRIRKKGQLLFSRDEPIGDIPVFWELEQGELGQSKTWIVSVSFSESFGLPPGVSKLIFDSLLDPSVKLRFKTEDFESDCVVYDFSEFADTNVIDIGSPDLPMSRLRINKPKS